jgi:DNA-binding response OmpR family regulator
MKKILIIEDEGTLSFLLSKALKSSGFEVEKAINGEEGIEKIKTTKPDLILLDLLLPGMDGFDFLANLKQNSEYGFIPVIVISNLSTEDAMRRALELGAAKYLVKANVDLNEIVSVVKSFIN